MHRPPSRWVSHGYLTGPMLREMGAVEETRSNIFKMLQKHPGRLGWSHDSTTFLVDSFGLPSTLWCWVMLDFLCGAYIAHWLIPEFTYTVFFQIVQASKSPTYLVQIMIWLTWRNQRMPRVFTIPCVKIIFDEKSFHCANEVLSISGCQLQLQAIHNWKLWSCRPRLDCMICCKMSQLMM